MVLAQPNVDLWLSYGAPRTLGGMRVVRRPILLLDEPTASLDAANRRIVVELIDEAKRNGTAIVGILHDREVRDAVADRLYPMEPLQDAA